MNYPFFGVLQKHLPCFNDYYVENTHSKIRANTSSNTIVDNIIKQVYVIMNQDPIFKDTYCKIRHYPYNIPMLNFLSNKTNFFLLQYFHSLYCNLGKSTPKLKNRKNKKQLSNIYILATLGEEVDLQRLPIGYSTSYSSKQGLHHKIRANTSSNTIVDNIIKQVYVIMNQDPIFKDTYCKIRHYPYNIPMLNFLSNKTNFFLLQYFHSLYCNLGKSTPKLKNRKNKKQLSNIYILATLGEEVDLQRLPIGYSTSYSSKQGLHQIEKGADTLTQEDLGDDDINDIEEGEEQLKEIEIQDILNNLEIKINKIENW
ncbi:hypothetical protein Glove_495g50 [Diversispora epigaea]|uniref:Uncharacterized protein n=1 Tax=Diversispora epigaea TaxID=1348612 RepID=A0A397GLE7_9GLOM|nr:hypothetical protein Glove_495g50 [Diversispora epigaea]